MDRSHTKKLFSGTGVALVTPFGKDGKIDFPALSRIIDHTIQGGVQYLVVLGTTGEPATLDKEEKIKVFEYIAHYCPSHIPLVAGIGGNNTQELIDQLKNFPLRNYKAILSVSPYYNKPSQEGIYQHYHALSEHSPLPIILYNVPGRTGSTLEARTTLQLAEKCPNIIGIKEASGSFDIFSKILKHRPKDFLVISGDDSLALPMISIGADGLISVLANSNPQEIASMVDKGLKGDYIAAAHIHHRISDLIPLLFKESNPTGVKAILKELSIAEDWVRLPLVIASEDLRKEIAIQLKSLSV